jgi:phage shock protein C
MKLTKSISDKFLFGVCGGLANYFGFDATVIRIAMFLGALFSFGTMFVAYIVMAVIMPNEDNY